MKKIFTTLFALGYVAFSFAQVIPNNEFETWSGGKPTSWDAPNVLGTNTVTQETASPQSGTSSVKIETKTSLVGTIPGFITLGIFNLTTQSVTGGIPFPYRPDKLKGYYKCTPSGTDQGFIGVGLSKIYSGVRDTIGQGVLLFPTAASVWTPFEVPITWTNSDIPDSLNILISSSNLPASGTFVVGSLFWVDSLYFEYPTVGVTENTKPSFGISQCYPNPFTDFTNINFTSPENTVYDFSVINIVGVEVFKSQINAKAGMNNYYFSAADLPSGIYIFNMKNGAYNQSKSMVINK